MTVIRKKQALCIASVASNLDNFNRSNTEILLELGYEVTLAANFQSDEDINSKEKTDAFAKEMRAQGVHIVHIDFSRSLKKIGMQIKSARQVRKLLKRKFDLIHCHSPICAAIVRAEAETYRIKYGTKVFYTAHGFHFYNGAPWINWLFFYPAEKMLSRFTDVLITLNREDCQRARKKFYAGKTVYIPGVGISIEKFRKSGAGAEDKRRELGLKKDDIMLLSVGELSIRKNHNAVMEALKRLNDNRLHYFIAGIGKLEDAYKKNAEQPGLRGHIHLLGYRTDIAQLCQAADLYIFPSIQEGLPVALMEAIACKTPVVCSGIRGNTDLVTDSDCLFDPLDISSVADCIRRKVRLKDRDEIAQGMQSAVLSSYERLLKYDLLTVKKRMDMLYRIEGAKMPA